MVVLSFYHESIWTTKLVKMNSWNRFSPSKHFSNEFYRNCCPLWVVSLVACYCQQPIKREKSRFYSILLWKFRNLPSRDKVMGPWGYKWVTLFSLSVPGVLADCKTIPPQSTHNVHFRLSNVFFPTSCRLWGKRKDFPQFAWRNAGVLDIVGAQLINVRLLSWF